MSNIEFIDIAIDTHNMTTVADPISCNNVGIIDHRVAIGYKDHVLEITEYGDDGSIKTKATFNDVNLESFKAEPDDIGVIFSHIDYHQFTQFFSSLTNPNEFTITGIEDDNEHVDLVNIDHSQFVSCSQ